MGKEKTKTLKASSACVDFIAKYESFVSTPYKCSAGVWTNGFGNTFGVNEHTEPVTREEAYAKLTSNINNVEQLLHKYIKDIKLKQCQYDAIVSFTFNLGIGAFSRSNAYKEILKDADSKYIADSWITFRNAGGRFTRGLLLRRLDELKMYYKD